MPQQKWALVSVALADAYMDFILCRQAMEFYRHTAGAFLSWMESQQVTEPAEVMGRHVRQYLSRLIPNN